VQGALPLIFIIVFVFLSYMSLICYHALFNLNGFDLYGFWVKRTDSATLLNTAYYMSKMSPPICFNFMLLFFGNNRNIQKTNFYKVSVKY
jgi:hypothetical protein